MKKLFTLLVFTFAMVLGTQTVSAQEAKKVHEAPEVVAKEKVHQLHTQVNLSGEQQTALFRAYVAKDYNYNKYLTGLDKNSADYKKKKAEYDASFDETAKRTLSAEQYTALQKMEKKK